MSDFRSAGQPHLLGLVKRVLGFSNSTEAEERLRRLTPGDILLVEREIQRYYAFTAHTVSGEVQRKTPHIVWPYLLSDRTVPLGWDAETGNRQIAALSVCFPRIMLLDASQGLFTQCGGPLAHKFLAAYVRNLVSMSARLDSGCLVIRGPCNLLPSDLPLLTTATAELQQNERTLAVVEETVAQNSSRSLVDWTTFSFKYPSYIQFGLVLAPEEPGAERRLSPQVATVHALWELLVAGRLNSAWMCDSAGLHHMVCGLANAVGAIAHAASGRELIVARSWGLDFPDLSAFDHATIEAVRVLPEVSTWQNVLNRNLDRGTAMDIEAMQASARSIERCVARAGGQIGEKQMVLTISVLEERENWWSDGESERLFERDGLRTAARFLHDCITGTAPVAGYPVRRFLFTLAEKVVTESSPPVARKPQVADPWAERDRGPEEVVASARVLELAGDLERAERIVDNRIAEFSGYWYRPAVRHLLQYRACLDLKRGNDKVGLQALRSLIREADKEYPFESLVAILNYCLYHTACRNLKVAFPALAFFYHLLLRIRNTRIRRTGQVVGLLAGLSETSAPIPVVGATNIAASHQRLGLHIAGAVALASGVLWLHREHQDRATNDIHDAEQAFLDTGSYVEACYAAAIRVFCGRATKAEIDRLDWYQTVVHAKPVLSLCSRALRSAADRSHPSADDIDDALRGLPIIPVYPDIAAFMLPVAGGPDHWNRAHVLIMKVLDSFFSVYLHPSRLLMDDSQTIDCLLP